MNNEIKQVKTTEEVYYKGLYLVDGLPCGRMLYTKRKTKAELSVDYIIISFRGKDKNEALEYMKKIEKEENFVTWNISDEGVLLYKDIKITFDKK